MLFHSKVGRWSNNFIFALKKANITLGGTLEGILGGVLMGKNVPPKMFLQYRQIHNDECS
jgi:hypothetical protein